MVTRRVLIGGFKHETNTFSVLPTDLDAYRARCLVSGESVIDTFTDTNTEIAGFLDVCAEKGWQPIPSIVADASPSGSVTREAYESIAGQLIRDASAAPGPDAILLQLHGAMVAEHATDGEGYLLQQLRDIVGPEVPIGVTLDLHANVSDLMARHADVIVSYRTYPHIDQREVAVECAGLIARILEGEIRTACHVRRPPMLTGLDHGRTTAPGPMREALKLASEVSVEPDVFSTSVLAGFSPADTADAGPSVVVVAQRENQQAQHTGDRIIEHIWNTRKTETVALASTEQAVATAKDKGKPGTPVVIADFADNPGGGGYGDSNALLRALIDSRLQHVLFGALYDPDSAAACHQAKVGDSIALEIGGKIDPAFGPPLNANAKIEALTNGQFHLAGPMQAGMPIDMGPSAMVLVNGVHIVLGSRRFQNFDRMYFESFGADLNKAAVIAVKSAQHFRAAYGENASEIVVVDDGNGITTENLTGRNYTAVRRPVYPLDF